MVPKHERSTPNTSAKVVKAKATAPVATNVDPYQCVLCGARMVFSSVEIGSRAEALLAQRHRQLEKKRWLLAA